MNAVVAQLGDPLPTTGRLLAVDLGEVRVGLALSDPDQVVASPLETVDVPRGDDAATVDRLCDAVTRHQPAAIVVGLPRALDGSEGAAAQHARAIAAHLRERTGLAVGLVDERLSTVEAERVMLAQDASRASRRHSVDRVAAGVLLSTVLESQRRRRPT